jgi:hypothetical protein
MVILSISRESLFDNILSRYRKRQARYTANTHTHTRGLLPAEKRQPWVRRDDEREPRWALFHWGTGHQSTRSRPPQGRPRLAWLMGTCTRLARRCARPWPSAPGPASSSSSLRSGGLHRGDGNRRHGPVGHVKRSNVDMTGSAMQRFKPDASQDRVGQNGPGPIPRGLSSAGPLRDRLRGPFHGLMSRPAQHAGPPSQGNCKHLESLRNRHETCLLDSCGLKDLPFPLHPRILPENKSH